MNRLYILTLALFGFLLIGCQPDDLLSEATLAPAVTLDETASDTALPTIASVAEVPPTATAEPIPTDIPPTEVAPTELPEILVTPVPSATPEPAPETAGIQLPGVELFNFVAGEPVWFTVDDDVMGGVSSSTVEVVDPNSLYFTGTMSLENNGGFSSVRSDWTKTDLSAADGILLRVKGDGKIYRLRIRTETAGRNVSYNTLFQTEEGEWTVIYAPFDTMVPTYFGSIVDTGPIDTANIGSFGFMLSDKQSGEFELQVDWMRAVTEAELAAYGASTN